MEVRNIPIAQLKWITSERERKEVPADYFLLPGDRKFPYKNRDGSLNCNLVRAAISRAAQFNYASVESKARSIYEQYCKKEESDSMLNVVELEMELVEGGFWHNVLPIKKFYDPRYGEVNITPELVKQMAKNFEKKIPHYRPSLFMGHDGDRKAYGEVQKLEARDDGLWAYVVLDSEGKKLVKGKKFKYLSAEFVEHYMDKETGEDAGAVFLGVALTNQPAHPSMTPITVFEDFTKGGFDMGENPVKSEKKLLEEKVISLEEEKKQLTEKLAEVKKELEEKEKVLKEKESDLVEKTKKLAEYEKKVFEQKKELWAKQWIEKGAMPATVNKMKELSEKEEDLKTFDEVLETIPKVGLGREGTEESGDIYKEAAKKISEYAK